LRPLYLLSKTPYAGVRHIPILSIRFLTPPIDFSQYEGVVFTSKQGIEAVEAYPIEWKNLRCICVSDPTAEYARQRGVMDVEVAQGYGETIPGLLISGSHKGKWLYPRPKVVASSWVDQVRAHGIMIDEAIVYETVCNPEAHLETIEKDAVLIFTSPSSVECFLQRMPILPTHTVVVIGTTTQKALPSGIDAYVSEEQRVASVVSLACQIAQKG